MDVVSDRESRERDFHDRRFSAPEARPSDRFYAIASGCSAGYREELRRFAPGRTVLEYGCGAGTSAAELVGLGSNVTAIDISPIAIELATEDARGRGLAIDFHEMNAERLSFADDSFDVVCGSGILHHLDIERAFYEISRVLRPDGCAIFSEPLGHNPLINAYRTRTPDQRSEDEHPLVVGDFAVARGYFDRVDVRYYHLATLAAIPFAEKPYVGRLSSALDALDRVVFAAVPPLRRYAWLSVITLRGPVVSTPVRRAS